MNSLVPPPAALPLPRHAHPTPAPRILALDLALAATGIACTHDHEGHPRLTLRTAAPRTGGHERLHDLAVEVAAAARSWPQLAVIEGLFVGHNNNTIPLAGLHAVVTQWLWYQGIPYVCVAPATLKVYATGNGGADKPDVVQAVRLTYGHLLPDGVAGVGDDNQADALVLLAMACDRYGSPLVELPRTHRRALKSVEWPEIPLPGSAAATAAARRGSGVIVP